MRSICIALVLGVLSQTGLAETPVLRARVNAGQTSNRRLVSTGFYLSVMGDPYPSLAGANIAVNLLDFMRLTGGMGGYVGGLGSSLGARADAATATAYAGGLRVLVPNWSFSPMVGISYSHLEIAGPRGKTSIQGIRESGDYWYGTLGLDWQSPAGFNVGAGCNVSLLASGSALPYINIGYFFQLI